MMYQCDNLDHSCLTLSKGCHEAPFVVLLKPVNAAPALLSLSVFVVQVPSEVAFLTCTLIPGAADLTGMHLEQRDEQR